MLVALLADYASTKGANNPAMTTFTLGGLGATQKLVGYSIRANVEPMHGVIFTAGYGNEKLSQAGIAFDATTTQYLFGVSYSLYQNLEIALTHQRDKTTNASTTTVGTLVLGDRNKTTTTMLQVEAVM